ncbi:MAG: hypothetical protein Q8P69_00920 [bacterium]|nr:hypothetical protein [bacterium]
MIKKLKKYFFAIPAVSLMTFMATSALANLPPGNPITFNVITVLVTDIAQFMIVTSMILAVIFIVLSGIMTMMAQANPSRFSNGLLRLKHATIGAGVVLATGVILATVASIVDGSFFCQISFLGICIIP